MSTPVLSSALVAQSGPTAAGPSLGDAAAVRAEPPAVPTVGNQEKLPLWARMLVIFGSALACWGAIIAAVAAVTR